MELDGAMHMHEVEKDKPMHRGRLDKQSVLRPIAGIPGCVWLGLTESWRGMAAYMRVWRTVRISAFPQE